MFESTLEQQYHFKEDLHRANLVRKLRGLPPSIGVALELNNSDDVSIIDKKNEVDEMSQSSSDDEDEDDEIVLNSKGKSYFS